MTDRPKMRCLAALALAVTLTMPAGESLAAQSQPLPAFAVTAPDGRTVASSALSRDAQWVMVYVRPGAVATARLLDAMATWQLAPEQLRRVVLIVEGPRDRAAAVLRPKGAAAIDLTWFADESGQAASAFGLTGAPALRGIRAGAIEWTLDGALGDPAAYASVVKKWIGAL